MNRDVFGSIFTRMQESLRAFISTKSTATKALSRLTLEAPHFLKWMDTVRSFFDGDIQKVEMKTLFPSDDGWEKQKPALLNW